MTLWIRYEDKTEERYYDVDAYRMDDGSDDIIVRDSEGKERRLFTTKDILDIKLLDDESTEGYEEEEYEVLKECPGKKTKIVARCAVAAYSIGFVILLYFSSHAHTNIKNKKTEDINWITNTTSVTSQTPGQTSQYSTVQSSLSTTTTTAESSATDATLVYGPTTPNPLLIVQEDRSEAETIFIPETENISSDTQSISEEPFVEATEPQYEESQSQVATDSKRIQNYTYGSWEEYYAGLDNCNGYYVAEENLHGFTADDIILLRKIVSSEYGGAFISVRDKAMVVCGTINQLRSGQYSDTILDCLNKSCTPWGFNPYHDYTIDQSIVDAVEYCFQERLWEDYNHCGWSGWGTLSWDWEWYGPWPNDYILEGV